MEKEELEVVREAIDKYGNSFWNDPSEDCVMGDEYGTDTCSMRF